MIRPHDYEFKSVRILGNGAYGEVWLVTNKKNEQFAMKKIPVSTTDEGVPQSVIREVASLIGLRNLNHPNILHLLDVFLKRKDGQLSLNILCEKCDWDLAEFLRKIPHDMCNAQCKHFSRQIFSAIDFLHTNNIVHRDLKPQNILVNKDQTLRVADFGLSRNHGLHSTLTTEVVTLWYRSPELLLQCKYSSCADIWSAGCIFAELYLRDALFKADTEAQQLRTIFKKLGTPPASVWPIDAIIPRAFYGDVRPPSLFNSLPKLPNKAIELLIEILNFNPHERPTATECLQHHYFN